MPPRQARQQAANASAALGSLPVEGGTKASDACAHPSPPNRAASMPHLFANVGQGFAGTWIDEQIEADIMVPVEHRAPAASAAESLAAPTFPSPP